MKTFTNKDYSVLFQDIKEFPEVLKLLTKITNKKLFNDDVNYVSLSGRNNNYLLKIIVEDNKITDISKVVSDTGRVSEVTVSCTMFDFMDIIFYYTDETYTLPYDLYNNYLLLYNFFNNKLKDDEEITRDLLNISYYFLDEHYGECVRDGIKIYSYRCDDEMRINFFIDSDSYLVSSRIYKTHAQSLINTEYGTPMTRKEAMEIIDIIVKNYMPINISPRILNCLKKYKEIKDYL